MEGVTNVFDDVIVFDNNYLDRYPRLHNRLIEISKNCEDRYEKCGNLYKDLCPTSFTVIRFARAPNPDMELDEQVGSIMGYLIIVSHGENEIWGMCNAKTDYYEKVWDSLLSVVVKILEDRGGNIYISLSRENPLWSSLLTLYTSKGFHSPHLSNKTPLGFQGKTSSVWFLWDGREVDSELTITSANNMKNILELCTLDYVISKTLAKKLFKYTTESTEKAGILHISRWEGHRAILGLDRDTVVKGSPPPLYQVRLPQSHLSFHSHPSLCDNTNWNCYIDWPTVDDILFLIDSYLDVKDSTYMHLVVVDKGIYFLSLKYSFQQLLNGESREEIVSYKNKIRDILEKVVEDNATKVKESRVVKVEEESEDEDDFRGGEEVDTVEHNPLFAHSLNKGLKDAFMKKVHTISLEDIKEESGEEEEETSLNDSEMREDDLNLFEVVFVERVKFDREDYLINRLDYYGKCPIEEKVVAKARLVI